MRIQAIFLLQLSVFLITVLSIMIPNSQNVVYASKDINSQQLSLLRFPLAVVIIAIHIFADKPAGYTAAGFPLFSAVKSFLSAFLSFQSVPVYFFISGFLFFFGLKTWNTAKWVNKIKNRKNTLLIPYLLWNCLCFLLFMTYYRDFANFNIKSFFSCFWGYDGMITGAPPSTMPINYPLWFLKDLIIVVLLTPLLWYVLKKSGKFVLSFFAFLWFLKYFGVIDFYIPAQGLFFFSFGAYMSLNGKSITTEFGKFFKLSVYGYLILGIVSMCFYNVNPQIFKILKFALILFGLFFALNLSGWLLKNGYCKVNEFLSSASFFMYVSHALVISTISKMLIKIFSPASDLSWLVVYMLNLMLTVVLLLSAYHLISRFFPKALSLLTGRKGR